MNKDDLNIGESLWTKYRSIVEANKEKRKLKGNWHENEPAELISDPNKEDEVPWEYNQLLSQQWVHDLFDTDWITVSKLLSVRTPDMVFIGDCPYYRESYITEVLSVLQALAKTNFVNVLRPLPHQVVSMSEPVYSSEDLMRILNVKESTLRKYRDNLKLGYTRIGDKIWYTQKDLDDFLNNPQYRMEADKV